MQNLPKIILPVFTGFALVAAAIVAVPSANAASACGVVKKACAKDPSGAVCQSYRKIARMQGESCADQDYSRSTSARQHQGTQSASIQKDNCVQKDQETTGHVYFKNTCSYSVKFILCKKTESGSWTCGGLHTERPRSNNAYNGIPRNQTYSSGGLSPAYTQVWAAWCKTSETSCIREIKALKDRTNSSGRDPR